MMNRSLTIFIASALALFGCQRPPEMQIIEDVAEAMGGRRSVLRAENLVFQGTSGRQYRLGQNRDPNDDLPYWEIDEYRREIDLQTGRWRLTQTRTSAFLTGNPVLRQEQVLGLDGNVAYDGRSDGTARRVGEAVARARAAEFYHYPVALVQLAESEGATVSNLRQEDGQDVVDVTSPDGETYTLYVDPETKYPSKIVSSSDHPNLGDVTLTTEFDDYQATGGLGGFQARLTLPRRITARLDEWPTWDLRVAIDVNQDLGNLSAPEAVRSAAEPEFQANVQVVEVVDGVWHLTGQSHHSVLVEFDEFLALVEAPMPEARTLAVIEQARQLQPDKPLQFLINTHHHFDHSGGVRAAVSEGLTIVTHEINREFFEDLVASPRTIQPDALARNPEALNLELVTADEVYELTDGRRTMHVVRVFQDEHCADMLMVHLPQERLLIEADVFSPGSPIAPFAPNLLKNVNDLEWEVDRIVPLHGDVVEFAALEEVGAAEAKRR